MMPMAFVSCDLLMKPPSLLGRHFTDSDPMCSRARASVRSRHQHCRPSSHRQAKWPALQVHLCMSHGRHTGPGTAPSPGRGAHRETDLWANILPGGLGGESLSWTNMASMSKQCAGQ